MKKPQEKECHETETRTGTILRRDSFSMTTPLHRWEVKGELRSVPGLNSSLVHTGGGV